MRPYYRWLGSGSRLVGVMGGGGGGGTHWSCRRHCQIWCQVEWGSGMGGAGGRKGGKKMAWEGGRRCGLGMECAGRSCLRMRVRAILLPKIFLCFLISLFYICILVPFLVFFVFSFFFCLKLQHLLASLLLAKD